MDSQNRSRAYPAMDLEEASGSLRKILASEWRERTRAQVAEALGYASGSSGIAVRKVAALGHFGYLRYRNGLYSPTELAIRVVSAERREDMEAALRQAFMEPALFRDVLFKYEVLGRLPWRLADALADHGITASAKEEAARILLRSGTYAGVLDEKGTLRDIYYTAFGRPRPNPAQTLPLAPVDAKDSSEPQVFQFALTEGKEAMIRLPFYLNELDLELLKAQLTVIELQVKSNKPAQTIPFPVRKPS